MAPVSKTGILHGIASSNLALSAILDTTLHNMCWTVREVMPGAWLRQDCTTEVVGRGSQGDVVPVEAPPGRRVALNDDKSWWDKLGRSNRT